MNAILELTNTAKYLLENKDELPVVYIAGKVTGLPYQQVYTKFKAKQLELEKQGFFVLNPCEHIAATADWQEAMRTALVLLTSSQHIYLLPDWRFSEGATVERCLALKLGINTLEG